MQSKVRSIQRREVQSAVLPSLASLPPILQRIYAARAVSDMTEVTHELSGLQDFRALAGMEKAVDRLVLALSRQERILIVGDFDADGATSSAVAVRALRAMGALQVDYLVPNRFTYGYGLSPEIVQVAATRHPQLLVTVDNGISSHAGISEANRLGMDVIVTDHHVAPSVLPDACAIVNPNQPGDLFPSKSLAGVGVIFYVMIALRARLREQGWFTDKEPSLSDCLDLVALGTVADVVPLDRNNRILVRQGLKRIQAGRACWGIKALLTVAGRVPAEVEAGDLGFALGPRLNAAGRLEDMSIGIACLLSDSWEEALSYAQQLDDLNRERRHIEADMSQTAFDAVDQLVMGGRLPAGLCLYEPEWHQGVIGLVASRVKEMHHRPVIAFALADESGEWLKGSARSIPGFHIRDALARLATQYAWLEKFGGHAMAAGLSLRTADLPAFSSAFATDVEQMLGPQGISPVWDSDGALAHHELTLPTAELLQSAGPFGQGFPEPLFDGVFEVLDQRLVGQRHLKLRLLPEDSNYPIDAIAFNIDDTEWPNARCRRVQAVYRLAVQSYQGRRSVQLVVEQLVVIAESSNLRIL
ncbi:MAG: single-stranded-DNA-specific exonuclease RecJ [Gammaproteobacteria bacterium RIFCSPHIGHO2_12_FULL_45_9]|nr:MAG: single-stranded-DNA-specific exonuclease RecJ [Gammaproteobacteria bacterium RIFCSPHIGHO2_12_FULL_45_9]